MSQTAKCRRRKIGSRRFDVNLDVHLIVVRGAEIGLEGIGVVRNLSMRGALIETHTLLKANDELAVYLTFPNHLDQVEIQRTVIRWIRGHQMGLEFLKMDPYASRQLMKFLAGIHGATRMQCEPTDTTMLAMVSEKAFLQNIQRQ